MRKMTPVVLNTEAEQEVSKQLGTQELAKAAPKSRDPINFPVFEVPVNSKVLCYVPKHIVQGADGKDVLRMDKPLIHSLQVGKSYMSVRCIQGLVVESAGYTGDCPLCDGCSEPWDLANAIIQQKCSQANLDADDKEAENVKAIRSAAYSDRDLKDSNRYFTFPIVVFETEGDEGKVPLKDENGELKFKTYWYSVSETKWEETWAKTLEGMEDEPNHPGGHFFILNYCYKPKRGEPNKRDSARALAVIAKKIGKSEKLREALDKRTEDWTVEKARETIISHALFSPADLAILADDALESTRNLLALYEAAKAGVTTKATDEAPMKLTEKVEETPEEVDMGETDLDLE